MAPYITVAPPVARQSRILPHLETMKCAVAIVLALFGVALANPVPSGLGWGGLGTVVVPGSAVSMSSSVINHGLTIPVVKPIISAPIITAPIIRTPIISAPIIRTPIITSPWLSSPVGLGWGGLGGLGLSGLGLGKGWH